MMPLGTRGQADSALRDCLASYVAANMTGEIARLWKNFRASACGREWYEYIADAQHRRCCYCDHSPARTIDHLTKKSTLTAAFDSDNWACSCGDCNRDKGTKTVVNPFCDDPWLYFGFDVVTGTPEPRESLSKRRRLIAERTLSLGFDNDVLNDARRRTRQKVVELLGDLINGEPTAHRRLREELAESRPHRAILRELFSETDGSLNPFFPLVAAAISVIPALHAWAADPLNNAI